MNLPDDFLEARRKELDPLIPAAEGPRAQLRARLTRQPDRVLLWLPVAGVLALTVFLLFMREFPPTSGDRAIPSASLTPGETRPVRVSDICSVHPPEARTIPASVRQEVFERYGISPAKPDAYEIDYLITPELGGADSIDNLWPEPYASAWNAHVKDALEERLHGMVCSGQIDLATAQREIAADWIGAYKKYFHTNRP
jgi:hypothetical protein